MLLSLAGCEFSPRDPTMIRVISHNAEARFKVAVEADGAVIEIFSPQGIGQAAFEITAPNAPEKILLRFHLRGLEELRFAYHETVVTASMTSSDKHDIRQNLSRAGEKPANPQVISSSSPFWMQIRVKSRGAIPLREGYIEVEAPADFLQSGARQASIQWIDFYR